VFTARYFKFHLSIYFNTNNNTMTHIFNLIWIYFYNLFKIALNKWVLQRFSIFG